MDGGVDNKGGTKKSPEERNNKRDIKKERVGRKEGRRKSPTALVSSSCLGPIPEGQKLKAPKRGQKDNSIQLSPRERDRTMAWLYASPGGQLGPPCDPRNQDSCPSTSLSHPREIKLLPLLAKTEGKSPKQGVVLLMERSGEILQACPGWGGSRASFGTQGHTGTQPKKSNWEKNQDSSWCPKISPVFYLSVSLHPLLVFLFTKAKRC